MHYVDIKRSTATALLAASITLIGAPAAATPHAAAPGMDRGATATADPSPGASAQATGHPTNPGAETRTARPAPPGTDFRYNGTRLRAYPSPRAPVRGLGYRGDRIKQLDNRLVLHAKYRCNGNPDPWWNKVQNRRTGVVGWTPQCMINFRW